MGSHGPKTGQPRVPLTRIKVSAKQVSPPVVGGTRRWHQTVPAHGMAPFAFLQPKHPPCNIGTKDANQDIAEGILSPFLESHRDRNWYRILPLALEIFGNILPKDRFPNMALDIFSPEIPGVEGSPMYASSSLREMISRLTRRRHRWVVLNLFQMEPDSGEGQRLELDLGLYQMESPVT